MLHSVWPSDPMDKNNDYSDANYDKFRPVQNLFNLPNIMIVRENWLEYDVKYREKLQWSISYTPIIAGGNEDSNTEATGQGDKYT